MPGTELRLGRLRDGEHQHRPGVDVTFSAPKSVSLEALVYAPPKTRARVVRAHDEAVRATLDFIETELLQTRSYDPETGRRPAGAGETAWRRPPSAIWRAATSTRSFTPTR